VRSSNAAHPEDGVARWVTGPTAFERTRRHGGVPATSRSNDFANSRQARRDGAAGMGPLLRLAETAGRDNSNKAEKANDDGAASRQKRS
jgi:hypothetical protein